MLEYQRELEKKTAGNTSYRKSFQNKWYMWQGSLLQKRKREPGTDINAVQQSNIPALPVTDPGKNCNSTGMKAQGKQKEPTEPTSPLQLHENLGH